jgi:hypothetical protein
MQLDKLNSLFPNALIVGKLYTFSSWSSTDHCYHTTAVAVCIESCDLNKQMELFNDISDLQDTPEDYRNTNWNTCETFVGFLIREKYLVPIELEEVIFAGVEVKGPVGLECIAADYAKYKAEQTSKKVNLLTAADIIKPNEDIPEVGTMRTDGKFTITTKRKSESQLITEGQVCTFTSWVFETDSYDPYKTCVCLKDFDISQLRAEWEAHRLNVANDREMHWETCVAFADYVIEAGYLKEIPVTEMVVYHQTTEIITTIKG